MDCVQGDITALEFPTDFFDIVVCTEVLEHIPSDKLARACPELSRVAIYEVKSFLRSSESLIAFSMLSAFEPS